MAGRQINRKGLRHKDFAVFSQFCAKSLPSAFTHIKYKGALSRGFCCVQVNSVLKSLLSTFTHITYKGALSRGFCCVQVNYVLKSLLSTFTHITYKGVLSQGFCCFQSILCKIIA